MAKPVTVRDWGKGVNKDQLPYELAPGFWSDCQNMRFRDGVAERMGGIASVITPSITPYWMLPYSSGATRYLTYPGTQKVYVHSGSAETNVTRKTKAAATISQIGFVPGFWRFITATAHGLATGDIVTTQNVSDSDYDVSEGEVTVFSSTEFRLPSPETSSFGPVSESSGTYAVIASATGSDNNFTGGVDDKWTGGNFNGVAFYNSPIDGLWYWYGDTAVSMLKAPNGAPVATFARVFKDYIIYGGPTISGTLYRHRVGWSEAAEPGSVPKSWAATETNDAGDQDIVSEGEMVDALEWGESFVVYKRDCRFRMTYIGGEFVWQFNLISGNYKDDGLLAQNCAVNTPVGQVFLTDGHDIRIHTGGESRSLAQGRVLKWLRANISQTNRKRSFLVANPYTNEVWACFPETGQSACSKALVWNWDTDAWGFRDLASVTSGCAGELPTAIASTARMVVGNATPKIGLVDSGTTDYGSAYTSMLERQGMDFDSRNWKTITDSLPQFDGSSNFTASISHGSSPTQDGTVTYASAQTYTHNTTRRVTAICNSGPWLAWKMTTTASDTPTLRSIDFWLREQGEW